MKFGIPWTAGLLLGCLALNNGLIAQQDVTGDFIFKIEPNKVTLGPNDELLLDVVVESKAKGSQGWSFGLDHDENILQLISVTTDGTDITLAAFPSLFNNTEPACETRTQGFAQSDPVCTAGGAGINIAAGLTQAILLSFSGDRDLPISGRFIMAKAKYKVRSGLQIGSGLTTEIGFTDALSATPGGPPVETTISIEDGVSKTPTGRNAKVQVKIQAEPELRLFMRLPEDRALKADKQDILPINIMLERSASSTGQLALLAWSYSIKMDKGLLAVSDFTPGATTAALKGGSGPEFKSYNMDDTSKDGTVHGVTAGVVIDLSAPFSDDIVLPAGGPAIHIETLKVKSSILLNTGDPGRTTTLQFVKDVIGENEPTDVVFTNQEGNSLTPDFATTQTINLSPGAGGVGKFVRGNANDDSHGVDIGDGVWIINFMFYGGPAINCIGAGDANDDNRIDLSDAVFIFLWQLQPGVAPGGQFFPRPSSPFPSCGTDPDLTADQCPVGSTRCDR